ncbi:MAG: NADH:flavin oxidoreductase [Bacteroidaceae bacterium]|nr:NADH:flavin oxidoreductase [Bacteroidaceae bacterium]
MNKIFEEAHIGPLRLRNRTIRSAAFESMCPGHEPSQQLYDYHTSVARGGIGMTTVAYAAVTESGLSFDRQLVMRPEIVPGLRRLTDGIHREGAAAGIQLGHCGNMSHRAICGCTPVGASTGFNLYSPTFVRGLRRDELPALAKAFGRATRLAREAGFDSVEVHCGHGYLIDQFLNPYFNHRRDDYGGTLERRMRFMEMCVGEVLEAAGGDMAVVCKMNMRDGLRHGITPEEHSIPVARRLSQMGVHAIVLSGGLVSATPMYVMRGELPLTTMTHYMDSWWLKTGIRLGRPLVKHVLTRPVPYREAFFLDDALRFRAALPQQTFIYVGGLVSGDKINEVLAHGFEAVQMARAVLREPDFVNRLRDDEHYRAACRHSNYCIGRMYTLDMRCHQCMQGEALPRSVAREIERIEREQNG